MNTTRARLSAFAAPALIASLAASAVAQDTTPAAMSRPSADIVDTAVKAGKFKTLVAAAKAAGLVDTLKSKGPLTVFAPTDEAFDKLPDGTVAALLKDKAKLAAILTYHVVPGELPAKKVVGMSWLKTAQGQSIQVRAGDDGVFVDNARVVKADIPTSNGVIHVIDSVILPRKDIVDTAVAADSFKTLVTAVKAAELVDTLKGEGPFTVFAPTDKAFGALPAGTVDSLLKDIPQLKSILTYHVVSGRVLAGDIPMSKGDKPSAMPKTVQGKTLTITRTKDGVMVNGARVIKADIIAGNGVIHVVDKVILP